MAVRKIEDNIYSVGAIDWDRRLFDELIPLPEGTSYNSYIIKGSEKAALIDTVNPTKIDELLANLEQLGISKIDYIISHHAEQDHSGGIPDVLDKFPQVKVVTNPKCKTFLMELLLIPEDKFIQKSDGDKLSLGDKTLEFIIAPWVHWPETMLTYIHQDKIIFTCDFFGSHLATPNLFAEDEDSLYISAKRYYAEIMMPFRKTVRNNLDKIKDYDIQIIAPSHGPLHNNPKFIMDAYRDWTSDEVKNQVLVPYISMHGSTEIMVEKLVDKLLQEGIYVKPFHITHTDIGELAMALVDCATVVLGTPTVLAGAHPQAIYAVFLLNALRPKIKFISVIGSYGWGGRTLEQIQSIITNLDAELIPPVIIKGYPKQDDIKAVESLAETIAQKHKQAGIF